MPTASGTRLWAVADDGARHDLTFEEHEAFWAWATVEVLRHTGIRAEELLELTHHSVIQYRLPTTGELVPLLQIAPSKTDTERLLLISPELADVLSAVISRIRDHTGKVPLVPAYDTTRRSGWQRCRCCSNALRRGEPGHTPPRHRDRAGPRGRRGRPDRPRRDTAGVHPARLPADLRHRRRHEGLPPHIGQVICGHRSIDTTMGYKATYPEETIEAHRAWIPDDEPLAPAPSTAPHRHRMGRVPRPLPTPQALPWHLRTRLQRQMHPRTRLHPLPHAAAPPHSTPRLVEVRDNLRDRITEAEQQGWLGEIEGLKTSLAAADTKLTDLKRLTTRQTTVHLGMPTIDRLVGRTATPGRDLLDARLPVRPNAQLAVIEYLLRPQRTEAVAR